MLLTRFFGGFSLACNALGVLFMISVFVSLLLTKLLKLKMKSRNLAIGPRHEQAINFIRYQFNNSFFTINFEETVESSLITNTYVDNKENIHKL